MSTERRRRYSASATTRSCLIRLACAGFLFLLAGCGATYKGELETVTGIREICAKENVGEQLSITFDAPVVTISYSDSGVPSGELFEFLDNQDFYSRLSSIVLASARVALSSDLDIKFFSVKVTDRSRGNSLSYTQYIGDIKKFIYEGISRDDYFNRVLLEYGASASGRNLKVTGLESFILRLAANRVVKKLKTEVYSLLFSIRQIEVAASVPGSVVFRIETVRPKRKTTKKAQRKAEVEYNVQKVRALIMKELTGLERAYGIRNSLRLVFEVK